MTNITIARELTAYKKMYTHIFNVVTDAIDTCQDARVKYLLKKAQQHTEEIYTGKNFRPEKMTTDEETIALLLHILIEQESKKQIPEQNLKLIEECKEWILDLEEDRISQFLSDFQKEP